MKKLILIGGTMGVGKTAVSRALLPLLQPGVWLDGDWCWNMSPFVVSAENKRMVMGNITHLLRAFLHNSGYEYVLFSWVLHEQSILDELLAALGGCTFSLCSFSLVCDAQSLRAHLRGDIEAGLRAPDVVERSVQRLPLYAKLHTRKLDVGRLTPADAALKIAGIVRTGEGRELGAPQSECTRTESNLTDLREENLQ